MNKKEAALKLAEHCTKPVKVMPEPEAATFQEPTHKSPKVILGGRSVGVAPDHSMKKYPGSGKTMPVPYRVAKREFSITKTSSPYKYVSACLQKLGCAVKPESSKALQALKELLK